MIIPTISLSSPPVKQPEGKVRKLLKHLEGDDYLLEIDNSSLGSFTICPREAEYKLVHSRSGAGGYALTYGKAIHASLEAYYKWKKEGTTSIADSSKIEEILSVGFAILDTTPPPLGEWRTKDALQNAVLKYIARYSTEDNFEVVAIEQPFAMPLTKFEVNGRVPYDRQTLVADCKEPTACGFTVGTIHISWTGVIDLILRDPNGLWIMDHKTSSRNDSALWKSFELTPQFNGYCWSAEKILGEKFLGAQANVLFGRKPTEKGTGKTLELERQSFYYKKEHIAEWETNTIKVMANFIHSLTSADFPMYTNNCTRKYGVCSFHDVCSQIPANRMTMLYSGAFTNNVWNPLDQ